MQPFWILRSFNPRDASRNHIRLGRGISSDCQYFRGWYSCLSRLLRCAKFFLEGGNPVCVRAYSHDELTFDVIHSKDKIRASRRLIDDPARWFTEVLPN